MVKVGLNTCLILAMSCLLSIQYRDSSTILCAAQEDGFGEDEQIDSMLDEMRAEDDYGGYGGDDPYAGMGGMGGYGDPYGGGYGGYDGGYGGGYGGDPYGGMGGGGGPPPGATSLDSIEAVDAFIKETDDMPVVVGYFDDDENEADYGIFMKLAERDGEHYRYAVVTNKAVLEEKKYDGSVVMVYLPTKYMNPKDDKPRARYPSKHIKDIVTLKTFVRQRSVPLVGEMTVKSEKVYRNTRLPVCTVFFNIDHQKNPKGYSYVVNRVRKVAAKHRNRINFNVANIEDFRKDIDQKYDIAEAYAPGQNILVGLRDGATYYKVDPTKAKFSQETLEKFVEEFKAGTLEGEEQFDDFLNKDEDDPTDDMVGLDNSAAGKDDGPTEVVTLTAQNFKEVVKSNKDADVLVEFYAPWCGHCKQLAPEFKRAAAAFKDDKGVVLAAMDATAHTVPKGFNVEGYPTLFFVPANDKANPVPYEGGRDANSMIQYLFKHRTTQLDKESPLYDALKDNKAAAGTGTTEDDDDDEL